MGLLSRLSGYPDSILAEIGIVQIDPFRIPAFSIFFPGRRLFHLGLLLSRFVLES